MRSIISSNSPLSQKEPIPKGGGVTFETNSEKGKNQIQLEDMNGIDHMSNSNVSLNLPNIGRMSSRVISGGASTFNDQ